MFKTVECPYCGNKMIILRMRSGIFRCGIYLKTIHVLNKYNLDNRTKIKKIRESYYNVGCGNPIKISLENGEIKLKKCLWSKSKTKDSLPSTIKNDLSKNTTNFIEFNGILPMPNSIPKKMTENTVYKFISREEYNENITKVSNEIKRVLNKNLNGNPNLLCSIYSGLNGLRAAGVYIPILTPSQLGFLRKYYMNNDGLDDPYLFIDAVCKKADVDPLRLGIGKFTIPGDNVVAIGLFSGTPDTAAGHHTIFIDIPNKDNIILNDDRINKVPKITSYKPTFSYIIFIVRELYDNPERNAFIELINKTKMNYKLPTLKQSIEARYNSNLYLQKNYI